MFRNAESKVFEGSWQQDKTTGLCVFRQFDSVERQNGSGIEVWSDGSYYCGGFSEGIKQGFGIYFWADGSRYAGEWI